MPVQVFAVVLVVLVGCGSDASEPADADADADVCAAPDAGVGATCAVSDDCACGDLCSALRCARPPGCGEVLLTWDGPVVNTDGTCFTDFGGFKVRWGTTMGGPYEHEADVGVDGCAAGPEMTCGLDGAMSMVAQLECGYRITDLPHGTVYITVVTYNAMGVESVPAAEISEELSCP